MTSKRATYRLLVLLCLGWFGAGCDTVAPVEDAKVVIQGFLQTGKPLPTMRLQQTQALSEPYPTPHTGIGNASVLLQLDGEAIRYLPNSETMGYYEPEEVIIVEEGMSYALDVQWGTEVAHASGRVPPPITIDSVLIEVPEAPIQAVFLDSLDQITNDLEIQGYIYAIDVALWWRTTFDEVAADSAYWVQTQLKPAESVSSTVLDLFLLNTEILRERDVVVDSLGHRSWAGVYAVQVPEVSSVLPTHELVISLIRSDEAYARFASSRDTPERREPVSNVEGGVGIFSAISLDSVHVRVEPASEH